MNATIRPACRLSGEIGIPGDKSISHRAIMLGAISRGITRVKNFPANQDCLSTIKAFEQMGIEIQTSSNEILVYGKGLRGLTAPSKPIDAGNSGTTARLLAGILAGQSFESMLDGDASLRKRPMKRVIEPLSMMGAKIAARDGGFLPLHISGGRLKGIEYTLPIASAQVKSAILLALLYANSPGTVHQPVISRDHTELMLKQFGGNIGISQHSITLTPVPDLYGQDITVPGDISSAAFFITAALLVPGSCIKIRNVGINPTRTGILDVYKRMGATIDIENVRNAEAEPVADIIVSASRLKGTTIEGDIIPRLIDEIPIIALAATQAEGTTVIRDAQELKVKESDRIKTVVDMLKGFGADIEATDDGMIIRGPSGLRGCKTAPTMDHRIAMTAAVVGLVASGETVITGAEWADISFPGFFDEINKLRS